MKAILQSVFLLSLIAVVTPGNHLRRRNESLSFFNKSCSLVDYSAQGLCQRVRSRLTCIGGLDRAWIHKPMHDITHLRVLEWPGTCVYFSEIHSYFPSLTTLELLNCTALHTTWDHSNTVSKIQELIIHGSPSLWEISPEAVDNMPLLRVLDVRDNGLRHMKRSLLSEPTNLKKVYLKGNHWDCSDGGLDWLAMMSNDSVIRKRIVDYDKLICKMYIGKPLHIVMNLIKVMHETCPNLCICKMTHVISDSAGKVIPVITLNCQQLQLLEPPEKLPPYTTTLRLDGNKINSIKAIIHNPQYKKLADLYLDNNSISAVKELEGSEWFTTFRVLSLRGNKLKQIPVYAFDKAFHVNNNILHVFLGHNPWRCDCHFIPRFQSLLLKYKRVIRDLTDIRCSRSDDKKTSFVQISTMPLSNVCSSEMEMPISTINIVNLVLLIFLMLVLGKFLYDWRQFKATGKLPWLSSIIP